MSVRSTVLTVVNSAVQVSCFLTDDFSFTCSLITERSIEISNCDWICLVV